ncbi:MAG: hypothetical protein QG568_421 [Patescibacteria group bacterium]|nr:hypothetical protein [Patescibacteria group bacterium]
MKKFFLVLLVLVLLVGLTAYYQHQKKWSYPNYIDNEPVMDNQVSYGDYKITDATLESVTEDSDAYKFESNIRVLWSTGAVTNHTQKLDERVMSVEVTDINFDGRDDLEIVVSTGAYNIASYFYTFDSAKGEFLEYMSLDGAVSLDIEKRQIETFYKGRGLGDMYSIDRHVFRNNIWQIVQQERQDIVDDSLTEAGGPTYYIKTLEDFENGTSTKKNLTYYKVESLDEEPWDFIEVSKSELVQNGILK